ncbi:predicted protein, partial [Naegleria gruberi]
MRLRYCEACQTYTIKYVCDNKSTTCEKNPVATRPAHPARFSPADTYSQYRIDLKRKYGLLPT